MAKDRIDILNQLLSQIEKNVPNKTLKNEAVSKSTIGWQLDHSLKVFNAVSESTEQSNPKDYKRKFNKWRTILFPLCYIPRGKARAPKRVLPPETISVEDINAQLKIAKAHTKTLAGLPKNAYFEHHIFGKLNKRQTLRFLEMHTYHHLKIINAILSKK